MKTIKHKVLAILGIASFVTISLTSCDKDGINGYMPTRPIGGYNSSSEIAATSRVSQLSFENGVVDSTGTLTGGAATGVTYVSGRKGMALKGSATGQVVFANPAASLLNMKSFTVAMWMNAQKHTDGAEVVFMLPRTSDFWGNMFLLIESNTGASDSMLMKFHFAGQWAELTGANRPANMYGSWKHVAFTYDAGTSKFNTYINGSKLSLPASITDRKSGTNPLGQIAFTDPSRFIIGGFQQHIGSPWSAADSWMKRYSGLLDEFRIYSKALDETEVNSLFKLEALGR